MTLSVVRLERFTAFEELDLRLSPAVNVFIGANGTGKTHLMKVAYAACDITKTKSLTGKELRDLNGCAPGDRQGVGGASPLR